MIYQACIVETDLSITKKERWSISNKDFQMKIGLNFWSAFCFIVRYFDFR